MISFKFFPLSFEETVEIVFEATSESFPEAAILIRIQKGTFLQCVRSYILKELYDQLFTSCSDEVLSVERDKVFFSAIFLEESIISLKPAVPAVVTPAHELVVGFVLDDGHVT